MRLDVLLRYSFANVKTLDGIVQLAIARNSEYWLYLHPKRDKSEKRVGWIEPLDSIGLLRAKMARAYGINYSVDPYTPANDNEIFHLFDYAANVLSFMSLDEIMATTERDLVHIHR
ncbi:hypothetical protein ODS41_00320 [Pyrobaculum sp. 3827-6]|uniref:hypothetical protein n=1 Tax=Pyrobaculum sp. 3827-6 TaxID=2983604 RepID=UPI0021DB3B4D|nr:hypothetical protein [Pyrobaculum sp. 3827-6]MCU7786377.1 hypothetical protein [Pyrobaculum sp. 3827-6]